MKSIIIQLIESKGIQVPKRDYEILMKNWEELQKDNPTLEQLTLSVEDIMY